MKASKITVALVGNPNSGKTTIFNNLTGARQHVGNYPGVTVEKKEGFLRFQNRDLVIIDLPGIYGFTAYSLDEVVSRNFIVEEKPDVIIDIIDGTNLERNLYLAVQLIEMGRPLVLALNMIDMVEAKGEIIDDALLAERLDVAVVRTVGSRRRGMEPLVAAAVSRAESQRPVSFKLNYGAPLEAGLAKLVDLLSGARRELKFPTRWLALKLLENDRDIQEKIGALEGGAAILEAAHQVRGEIQDKLGEEPELIIANQRFGFVGSLCREIVTVNKRQVSSPSERIDSILTHRLLGLPIFLGLMWLVFNLVFSLGAYPQEWIEQGVGLLGHWIGVYLPEGDLQSLVVDGVIGGVGSVLVFLPNIVLLFLGIALLEDTGYMARAAFIMDRIMHKVGLHGKSFIPLLLGFGCSVPAVMGTRTLENPQDRLLTILVAPLMSCSARLPVYTLLIAAFFSESLAGNVLFAIYMIGIVLAIVMARVFRSIFFPGSTEPFVMELPAYRLPSLRGILIHMWERSRLYLLKAGTIILAVSIIIWFLCNYPSNVNYTKDYQQLVEKQEQVFITGVQQEISGPLKISEPEKDPRLGPIISRLMAIEEEYDLKREGVSGEREKLNALTSAQQMKKDELVKANPQFYPYAVKYIQFKNHRDEVVDHLEKEQKREKLAQSYAGVIGKTIEPFIAPLGFDWKVGVGLVAAFTAKEVLVSTMATIYAVGEETGLKEALIADSTFTPLSAFALMIFVLIYSPCLATLAVIKRETNSWKWPLFSSAYTTVLAWLMALLVFQGGRMLGL
ncbi:ferrous iron transport protein B [Desulforamulus ruminis]|uniref:ferrous iron transport protein B n=1 Tax=Desulforamulus ruminis TaxID=1564 RepID=UPI002FD93821